MTAPQRHLVALATGGTGGHMFPAEALADELLTRGCRIAVVTDRRGGTFGGHSSDIETHRIVAAGLAGKSFAKRLLGVPELALGTLQARKLLKRLSPRVVVGFGGYASAPTMAAAVVGGYRTAIHEQNAILGRANRLLASRVKRIATSFGNPQGLSSEDLARAVHTGMPVRAAITEMRDRPYPELGNRTPINLLVLGGSQGARVFSQVVPHAAGQLSEGIRSRLRISQQCRPEDMETAQGVYRDLGLEAELSTFFDDVPERLAAAHLIIGRAGASTVAEITAVGRPAILVPYPHAIDDHQSVNAHFVDEAGAGWLMPEDSFNPASLALRLESLFDLPAILAKTAVCSLKASRPNAAERLADMVFEMLPSNGEPEENKKPEKEKPEKEKEAA